MVVYLNYLFPTPTEPQPNRWKQEILGLIHYILIPFFIVSLPYFIYTQQYDKALIISSGLATIQLIAFYYYKKAVYNFIKKNDLSLSK